MLKRLQEKWGVTPLQVILILITFTIGGSACSYLAKLVMSATGMEKSVTWFILYILLATIFWPFCVLAVSIFFGQFAFFKNYVGRMLARMFGKKQPESSK